MDAIPAVVLTQSQLNDMLEKAGQHAAELAVRQLRSELQQSPEQATLERLRGYLADPSIIANPREQWAHAGIIREIQPTPRGKPKSTAWFMRFQRESGLKGCPTRSSPVFGRRREWTFSDIRLAWLAYYAAR